MGSECAHCSCKAVVKFKEGGKSRLNVKMKERIFNISGKVLQNKVEKEKNKWPPHCMGILHQPKRQQSQKD